MRIISTARTVCIDTPTLPTRIITSLTFGRHFKVPLLALRPQTIQAPTHTLRPPLPQNPTVRTVRLSPNPTKHSHLQLVNTRLSPQEVH